MSLSPQGVARWSAKRRFTVIGIWVVLFLVGGLLTSRYLSGALTTQAQFTTTTPTPSRPSSCWSSG